jgi:outer membrane protein assembly factor BamB
MKDSRSAVLFVRFYSPKVEKEKAMKKKKTVKARLLSLVLVLLLLTGSVSGVHAQEAATMGVAENEIMKGQTVESGKGAVSGEQGSVPESTGSTDGSADVKKDEDTSSDRNVSAPSAVKKEAKATTVSDEDKTEAAGAGESEEPLTGYGMTVTLQIEGYGSTVEEGIEVTMPDTYKTFKEYGLENVADPIESGKPEYTILHVMAEYCEEAYGSAEGLIEISGGFVNSFLGMPAKSALMFLRNHKMSPVGAQEQKVQPGDLISVVDIWANSNWTIGGQYGWFSDENLKAEEGEAFTVQLNAEPLMWGEKANPSGATVMVVDSSGKTVAEGKTGSDGKASLTVEEAGTYAITAQRKSSYYDNDGSNPWDLVPPHGKLVVSEGVEVTDEEAVAQAKEKLELGDVSQVTENLILPVTGKNKTTITWSSSDENCIKINGTEGEVIRPTGADKKVTLTAVINRGDISDTKEFVVTVVGKSLFKELTVDQGTLVYDKSVDEYTVYIKKDIETLTIKGIAEEGVSVVKVKVMDETGEPKTEMVMSITEPTFPAFERTSYLIDKTGKDLLPYDITLETLGQISGTVTLHVKRGTAGTPLPDLPDITWGQHLGDKNNNAVVDSKAPTNKTELLWESFSNAPDSLGSVYAGTPILVNNHIYAVRNHKIEMLDAKTGEVKASTKLHSQIGYYSNIIYGGGMIFVPLGNGDVQCFNATTLKSMYLIENPASLGNSWGVYGAMHYDDGKLYVGYSNQGDYGGYAVYDTLDPNIDDEYEVVEPLWMTGEEDQSYYGAGAVTIEDMVVIGGDGGVVSVRNAKTGEELSKLQLSGKIRCSLVYADGYIWTTTQGKKIYKLLLSESGKITVAEEADLPNISNASPVVTGGKVYITGGVWGAGFFAVYDMNLTLLTQEKGENPFYTPTVSTAYDNVCVYFTENGPEGSLYMAEVTANNKITLTKIYTPEHQQYSMSKVIISSDGTIYYANDSGYLFAIRDKLGEVPEKPDDGKDDGKDDGNNGGGNNSSAGTTPSLKPDSKPTTTVSTQSFAPRKRTVKVNAATKNNVSSESNIVNAIQESYDKKENSLTIKNPPEVVGAEVFKQLAQYPEFRLVFDCGAYTLSMKGSDITNVNATLTTKLLEMENTLSEEDAARYGNYQQLMFAKEGPLPGKITVVYKLGEQFEQSEALYFYDLLGNTEAQEVILQKPYGMFVLENGGEFILSDQKVEEAQEAEVVEISEEIKPVNEKTTGIPVWIYLFIGLGAGALISGLITVKVMNARKRKDTWEK